jgi:hypothetical protein
MNAFVLALLQILQFLPSIIQTVELLHGPGKGEGQARERGEPGDGDRADDRGTLKVDPAKQAHVERVINTTVAILNATGKMSQG